MGLRWTRGSTGYQSEQPALRVPSIEPTCEGTHMAWRVYNRTSEAMHLLWALQGRFSAKPGGVRRAETLVPQRLILGNERAKSWDICSFTEWKLCGNPFLGLPLSLSGSQREHMTTLLGGNGKQKWKSKVEQAVPNGVCTSFPPSQP